VDKDELGCALAFAVMGTTVLAVGWFVGEFLLAPYHCGSPACEAMRNGQNRSTVGAFVGIGCVVLSAFTARFRRMLLLGTAVGAFAFTAVAGLKAGLRILPLIDAALMVAPIALFLHLEPARRATDPHIAQTESSAHRLYWLAMALFALTWLAIVFAILTAVTLGL
jgi:hypothetical protein